MAELSFPSSDAEPGSPGSARSPRALRRWISALLGFVIGFVVGAVIMAAVWIVTFARAISGEATLDLPGVIGIERTDGMTATVIGPLFLFAPIIVALVGAAIGAIARVRDPRPTPHLGG